jgi:glutamate-1-semialdehyde 2,1-aminomutase
VDLFIDQGISFIGHKAPAIRKAIDKALDRYGFHLEMCEELQTQWAKLVMKHYPSIKKIKIVNSGNEATELVCQIARAFTGKNKIIKFAGHHHGWNGALTYDALSAGSGTLFTLGIPNNHWDNLINLPPNDIGIVEKALKDNKDHVAAIVLEPLGASTGGAPLVDGFLKQLRELTSKYNVLLVFDEVATSFRVGIGGVQGVLGISPDLTCLGKPIGGGIPIGAVGGREDVMSVVGALDPRAEHFGPLFPMGSFCAHPLAMAGGIAFMEEVEKGNYIANSIARASDLAKGINEITERLKLDISAHSMYSIVHFGLNGKFDMSQVLEVFEFDLMIRLGLLLGNPGVVVLPGHVYMSGVVTEKDIQKCLGAFETAFKIYK